MKCLVFDVECTCWNDQSKDHVQEIIEIGYSIIENGKITGNGDIYIKPQKSGVSEFCTQLTGITREKLAKDGLNPKEAYAEWNKALSGCSLYASYGDFDVHMLQRMQSLYGIRIGMLRNHVNIRLLASKMLYGKNDRHAAPDNPKDTMEKIGMKFEGRNHNGAADAYNIARLYIELTGRIQNECFNY